MSIAFAHDYLTQRGGAERVVLSMLHAFPTASLYTSLYQPQSCFPGFRDIDIRVSTLNRVDAFRRWHRLAFPLFAPTFSRCVIDADVTVASSSGWAHGVQTRGRKIVYCHAPARWLYRPEQYLRHRSTIARGALSVAANHLRRWDAAAARSADTYLVNSTAIQRQVRDVYGIDAEILHPPHSVEVSGTRRSIVGLRPGYALCVARLQAYKNVDAVVDAFRRIPEVQLVVVGHGPMLPMLEQAAGRNVRFLGEVSDARLRWLYSHASVLIGASYEDFGLTPVEAAAFGVPTVALRAGGYLDTVDDGVTGSFFDTLRPDDIARAVEGVLGTGWNADAIRRHATAFDEESFIDRLRAIISPAGDPVSVERRPHAGVR